MAIIELDFNEFKEKMRTSNLVKDCIEKTNISSITRVAIIILSDQLTSFDKDTLEKYNIVSDIANKSTGAATNAVANGFENKDISVKESLDKCKKIRKDCKTETVKELMDLLINNNKGSIQQKYQKLKEYFEENKVEGIKVMTKEAKVLKTILEDIVCKENTKQIILTGAPGTGKTHQVREFIKTINNKQEGENKEYYSFVQFHSSYDYSDFVEGLRPVQIEKNESATFVRVDGIFKKFCRDVVEAINNNEDEKNKKYFFVIDEINRADLSRVFGELMFCLEESYRGKENVIKTQYHGLPTYRINKQQEGYKAEILVGESDVFEDGFYIPENVYIIGTMNDIDRSVETFDFALRRRFRWIEVDANGEMGAALSEILGDIDKENVNNLIECIKSMNQYIESRNDLGLNKAYQIGHGYFKSYNGNNLGEIWDNRIMPLLKEYCRGREMTLVEKFVEECKDKLFKSNATEESRG